MRTHRAFPYQLALQKLTIDFMWGWTVAHTSGQTRDKGKYQYRYLAVRTQPQTRNYGSPPSLG